jgi:hypothetical protein
MHTPITYGYLFMLTASDQVTIDDGVTNTTRRLSFARRRQLLTTMSRTIRGYTIKKWRRMRKWLTGTFPNFASLDKPLYESI